MVIRNVPECDVFGTTEDVKKYRVSYGLVDEAGDVGTNAIVINKDLCPRAYARLVKKIESGTTPPAKRKR